ncbi:MAG: ISLre2 family transposase [Dehalococcoidia bacterium]|nr:ISLre2 family transposase [Dehalococcoidia bacterium]
MDSIEGLAAILKAGVGRWEEVIFRWACDLAKAVAEHLLQKTDDDLMKSREAGLSVEGFRERWVTTLFGDVRIKRRLYSDGKGGSRFLLDEAMGLRKRSQASPKVEEVANFVSTLLPFGKCEQLLRALLPDGLSHTTIHRLVGRTVDPLVEEEERELAELFEDGVLPESQNKVVPYLMVEADGTYVSLQREKERRTEVKIGIAYEGWQGVGRGRYGLKEKTSYTGIMDGDRFWDGFSLTLAKKYNLSRVGRVIVGSDGAEWARQGADVFGGLYQLDRFHLLRAIYRGIGSDMAGEVYRACTAGEVDKADAILRQAQEAAEPEEAESIGQLRGYLLNNAHGLRDYRLVTGYDDGLRGLGGMESNVDKLLANRMKKRGMSWSKKGANRMARLLNLKQQGQLHLWVNHREKQHRPQPQPPKTSPRQVTKETGEWLEAVLPAISGPHADRPWAQLLKNISRQTGKTLKHDNRIPPTRG